MENTIENKAKFFALYWGQKILRCTATDGCGLDPFEVRLNERSLIFDYLELTPLSQITDEHAIEYINTIGCYSNDIRIKEFKTNIDQYLDDNFVIDYLRSKGYALPWMGLIVEQLVSFGWVKLKEG